MKKKGTEKGRVRDVLWEVLGLFWLALEVEEGQGLGTQALLKAGEGKEVDSPQELPEGSDLADTLILAQWDPVWNSDLLNFVLFEVTEFAVICYCSNRELEDVS